MARENMFGRVQSSDRWETTRRLFAEVSERNLRNQLAELEFMGQQQEQERKTALLERWRAGVQGVQTRDDVQELTAMIPMLSDDPAQQGQFLKQLERITPEKPIEEEAERRGAIVTAEEQARQRVRETSRVPPPSVEGELVGRMSDEELAKYMRSTYGIEVDPAQLQAQRGEVPRDVSRMTPYQMLITGKVTEEQFERMMNAGKRASREGERKYVIGNDGELSWNPDFDIQDALNESIAVEGQLSKLWETAETMVRRRLGRKFERQATQSPSPEFMEENPDFVGSALDAEIQQYINANYAAQFDNLIVKATALDKFINEIIPPPEEEPEGDNTQEETKSMWQRVLEFVRGESPNSWLIKRLRGGEESGELQLPSEGGF